MNTITITDILINKQDLCEVNAQTRTFDLDSLHTGQLVLVIDSFGFSANNITYGLLGEKMGYWGFFPHDSGYGRIPVWGFATVLASKHEDIGVGERVYGYLPMSSHLIIQADKVSPFGFSDVHPQRKSISPVYDHYVRCATDPGYVAELETWQLNYRPLFTTSFVLQEYVTANVSASVKQVILTSASSKTAYGTAFLLQANEARKQGLSVVGLTSSSNREFVEGLGCYDQVLTYDECEQLNTGVNSWVLDFAGNKPLLLNLQSRLGSKLEKMLFIGATDVASQSEGTEGHLNGELFFAPSQVKVLTDQWGRDGFAQRYAQNWQKFLATLDGEIGTNDYAGVDEIVDLYRCALAGHLANQKMVRAHF